MNGALDSPRVAIETRSAVGRRPKFSVCIPAYNRARHLPGLLDSIFAQSYPAFNLVICEDGSPERAQIRAIVRSYAESHPGAIAYYENETNLGYDGNIRNLVAKADGEFCFFMGNDDIMCPHALEKVADVLDRHPDVGMVLKSYAWFDQSPDQINQAVRYFTEERVLSAGRQAITVCYRRSGVISGYVVRRDPAHAAATSKFDGTLYYQMHLTASVLATLPAVTTPEVLILCRGNEPPLFGNSDREKGKYVPGGYTPEARLNMVQGVLTIIEDFKAVSGIDLVDEITRDYANYFYVYIKDQLTLPLRRFGWLYWSYARMGFGKYPMFHLYCTVAYLLGERRFDLLTKHIRNRLGHSPQFGGVGK
jgi:glycosyltransferase involved in cell wall biosynthesis